MPKVAKANVHAAKTGRTVPAVALPKVEGIAIAKARAGRTRRAERLAVVPEEVHTPRKHRQATLQAQLAAATGLPTMDVKLWWSALMDMCKKSLSEDGSCRLPGMALLHAKRTAARPPGKKIIFGKEKLLQAKPAGVKVSGVVLKPLREAVLAGECRGF